MSNVISCAHEHWSLRDRVRATREMLAIQATENSNNVKQQDRSRGEIEPRL